MELLYPESERVRRVIEHVREILRTSDDREELSSLTATMAALHTECMTDLLHRIAARPATPVPAAQRRALTVRAAAERLDVSEDTVREYIRTGELPVTRHGRSSDGRTLRLEADDVEDLVARRRRSGYGVRQAATRQVGPRLPRRLRA